MAIQQAFGTVNGQRAEFIPVTREFNDTPAEVAVTISMPMSYEDIAAVFFLVVNGGGLLSDLDDAVYARRLLLDTLINDSAHRIEETRLEMAELEPGTDEHELAQAIRARVAEIFSPVSAPAGRKRARVGVRR